MQLFYDLYIDKAWILNNEENGCDFAYQQELSGRKKVRIFVRYRQEVIENMTGESYPYMAIICIHKSVALMIKKLLDEVGFKKAKLYCRDEEETFRNGEVTIVIIYMEDISYYSIKDLEITDIIYWDTKATDTFHCWNTNDDSDYFCQWWLRHDTSLMRHMVLETNQGMGYEIVYDDDVTVDQMENVIWNQREITIDILNNWCDHKNTMPNDILATIIDFKGEQFFHEML